MPFPYNFIDLKHTLHSEFSSWNWSFGFVLIFFVLLQAKICYAAELNKAIFVLPEARHHEESEPREIFFKIDDKRSRPLNESHFNGFDSPDIAGSRDLDGGIMLTPDRILKDIDRQALINRQ